jgi:hypothetical protein
MTHEQARKIIAGGDSMLVIERVEKKGEPIAIAAAYLKLANDLYWKSKDLPASVAVSRAGIHFSLSAAVRDGANEEVREKLRGNAKAMAFNLGSFTWPGWDEKGIVITPADLWIGYDAARLNLRLAEELKKPPKTLASAQWLLGAQALARKSYDEAMGCFAMFAELADTEPDRLVAVGYASLAHLMANREVDRHATVFQQSVKLLAASPLADGPFFAQQLQVAHRVFVGGNERG